MHKYLQLETTEDRGCIFSMGESILTRIEYMHIIIVRTQWHLYLVVRHFAKAAAGKHAPHPTL